MYRSDELSCAIRKGELWLAGPISRLRMLALSRFLIGIARSRRKKARVWLSSMGGSIEALSMATSVMDSVPVRTEIVVFGTAMSAGAILLQHAHKRIMLPATTMLLHEPELTVMGHPVPVRKWVEHIKRQTDIEKRFILGRVNEARAKRDVRPLSMKELSALYAQEDVITAPEALELGLVDTITL